MKLSIKGQGHTLILVKDHSDFKVTFDFGLYTQVSDSGPHGPLVLDSLVSSHRSCGLHVQPNNL